MHTPHTNMNTHSHTNTHTHTHTHRHRHTQTHTHTHLTHILILKHTHILFSIIRQTRQLCLFENIFYILRTSFLMNVRSKLFIHMTLSVSRIYSYPSLRTLKETEQARPYSVYTQSVDYQETIQTRLHYIIIVRVFNWIKYMRPADLNKRANQN